MLPIGQELWLKELETYIEFPPLQDPASYNLDQVMQQVKNVERPVQRLTADDEHRAGAPKGRPRHCRVEASIAANTSVRGRSIMSRTGAHWLGLLASLAFARRRAIAPASAQQQKPNILVIMGDDIGYWNISAYNRGMMGYRTPNIDRIANEGAIFTDYYGQQSCTAGRAAFITGQSPMRTGLLKVGLPAAKEGLSDKDPTHRRTAQAAGLRDRPIRQEPSRRPQRVPADRARLRRVLRQPLSPERRGRAGASGLSEEPGIQGAVRPARRA